MTLTKQEIQDLIDRSSDKDIADLYNSESFDVRTLKWKYTVNKKFIEKYFYKQTLIREANDTWVSILSSLSESVKKLDYDESDWGKHIKYALSLIIKGVYSGADITACIVLTNKNPAFVRYLIKNTEKFASIIGSINGNNYKYSNRLVRSTVYGLTSDELEQLVVALNVYNEPPRERGIGVFIEDAPIIKTLFKSTPDIVQYSVQEGISLAGVYAESTKGEVISVIEYLLTKRPIMGYDKILNWFKSKKIILDDDLVDRIVKKWDRPNELIPVLSKEKTIEYFSKLSPVSLIENDNLSIDEVMEIFRNNPKSNTSKVDLCGTRFFTDEEIAKYPHLFSAKTLKEKPSAYVSKETFKLLNKAAGTRQPYNNDLSNFEKIIINYYADNDRNNVLNLQNILYLKEKTNCSNSEFISVLKNDIVSDIVSVVIDKNFQKFIKFLKQD